MISFSSRTFLPFFAILLVLGLSSCSTGWKSLDNLTGAAPQPSSPQVQAALPKKQVRGDNGAPIYQPSPYAPPNRNPAPPLTTYGGPESRVAMAAPLPPAPAKPGKVQVALLLPLSGKDAPLGQAMLNAAQMAVFDIAPQNFELMPRDTAKAEGAAQAARDATASGAELLIGPLFAREVAAVKPVAESANINVLALSTDASLAESGVYVMGFAPAPQVERVVSYAASHGAHRFAALIPATAYGKLVRKAFEESVQRHGGAIVAIDAPANVKAVADRRDQIDAIFLPLGGEELKQAAAQLASGGVDKNKVRLLGTGLWDEPGLGSRAEFLVGGWYAAAEPDAREDFVKKYKATYGKEPPRLATLTYDATALAAVIAARDGRFDRGSLTNPNGFAGLDGIFRLTSDGLAERGLAINEITSSGSRVIDPSPSTFVTTGR